MTLKGLNLTFDFKQSMLKIQNGISCIAAGFSLAHSHLLPSNPWDAEFIYQQKVLEIFSYFYWKWVIESASFEDDLNETFSRKIKKKFSDMPSASSSTYHRQKSFMHRIFIILNCCHHDSCSF